MDNKVKSPREIKYILKQEILGALPDVHPAKPKIVDWKKESSGLLEIYRLIKNEIFYAYPTPKKKNILVVSSLKNEGKTTIAINLSIAAAIEGQKVIYIDCDLRKDETQKILIESELITTIDEKATLLDVLNNKCKLEDIPIKTKLNNLDVIINSKRAVNPPKLLASYEMSNILSGLEKLYDWVVIDTAAILPVVDATILAERADGVIGIIDVSQTPRHCVEQMLERLAHVRAYVMGVIVNKVPPRFCGPFHTYYGYYYYDSEYYTTKEGAK
jgi:receptor protein-tyrosine kinase